MLQEEQIIQDMWNKLPVGIRDWFQKTYDISNPLELNGRKKGKAFWNITLYTRLFTEKLWAFKGELPAKITSLRKMIQEIDSKITVEKIDGPIPLMVATDFSSPKPALSRRHMMRFESWDVFFFLPSHGLSLASTTGETTFTQEIVDCLRLESIRIRALENTKLYNLHHKIVGLRIATIQEIAGFVGLDFIEFHGDNVKEGLKGLQIRQEIRVNLENMGPKLKVETDNLELEVAKGIRLKSLQGIDELSSIL